jgi:hypothetical protein
LWGVLIDARDDLGFVTRLNNKESDNNKSLKFTITPIM